MKLQPITLKEARRFVDLHHILRSESGVSLKASGFEQKVVGEVGGGTWHREGRPRVDTHPLEQKKLFERNL